MRFTWISFLCGLAAVLFAQNQQPSVEIQLNNASLTVAGSPAALHRMLGTEKISHGAELRINANFDKSTHVSGGSSTGAATGGNPAAADGTIAPALEDYLLDSPQTFVPGDPDLVVGNVQLANADALQLTFSSRIRVWAQIGADWLNVKSAHWYEFPVPEQTTINIRIEGIDGSTLTNDTIVEAAARSKSGVLVYDRVPMTVVKTAFMLSFDDGPVSPQTLITLKALSGIYVAGKPLRSVFFMVGESGGRARFFDIWSSRLTGVKSHPELARAVFDAGHYIGNHTAHHAGFTESWTEDDVVSEINGAETEIQQALGSKKFCTLPRLFRSPYLQDLPFITTGAQKCGYQVIWGRANLGESNPFLRYADIKKLSRDYLQQWNTRENPSRRTMPTLLVYHELHNDIAKNVQDIVTTLRSNGFVLCNFDPKLCYPKKSDY